MDKKASEETSEPKIIEMDIEDNGGKKKRSGLASKLICTAFSAAAWIILIHELLERFSFYGMKGILTLYLKHIGFGDDLATAIYHLFTGISYLTPILGGFLSDNFFGKFKTIVILGAVYLVGHALMPATAIINNVPGPMIAIFVLALGTGGIKPCVAAFGGDQIPEDDEQLLDVFFSLFYMMINIGAFISQLLTPILREIPCLGSDKCYPLGFGVPAVAFLLTYILFIVGKPTYKMSDKPKEPMLNKTFACIFHAIKMKFKAEKKNSETHWLDYAEGEKYDKDFITDVKTALSVAFLFLPFPIYWALFDQQGSRWTLQATAMDGYISENITVQPDQMQTVNPLLIVIIIPIFNNIVYPLLARCHLFQSATSRIFAGYLICSAAFILTGVMDIIIEQGLPATQVEGPYADLRVFNNQPCVATVEPTTKTILDFPKTTIDSKSFSPISVKFGLDITRVNGPFLRFNGNCFTSQDISLQISTGGFNTIIAKTTADSTEVLPDIRTVNGNTKVRVVLPKSLVMGNGSYLRMGDANESPKLEKFLSASRSLYYTDYANLTTRASYNIYLINENASPRLLSAVTQSDSSKLNYKTVLVEQISNNLQSYVMTEISFGLVHRAWQLPQYILMCISEVLFSVTAMAFAYSESPASLKSLLQTFYLITIFFGNMIVLVVALLPNLPKRAYEFFMFGCLVFVGGFIQLLIIYIYNKGKKKNKVEPLTLEVEESDSLNKSGPSTSSDSVKQSTDSGHSSPTIKTRNDNDKNDLEENEDTKDISKSRESLSKVNEAFEHSEQSNTNLDNDQNDNTNAE